MQFLIRDADLRAGDAARVGAMTEAYLVQTEREKAERGLSGWRAGTAALPEPYRSEVADPSRAYATCRVLVAEAGGEIVGLVVVTTNDRVAEIKRLWTAPTMRGHGIGSALLDAAVAVAAAAEAVRLSVWEWRQNAILLYESRGFDRMPSWDSRKGLVCLQRGG